MKKIMTALKKKVIHINPHNLLMKKKNQKLALTFY